MNTADMISKFKNGDIVVIRIADWLANWDTMYYWSGGMIKFNTYRLDNYKMDLYNIPSTYTLHKLFAMVDFYPSYFHVKPMCNSKSKRCI